MSNRFKRLATEQRNPRSRALDTLSVEGILSLMDSEEPRVLKAVRGERFRIVRAVELLVRSLRSGGRVIFVGAGTSGRMGVLEAAECPPTFNTSRDQIQAVMAGGPRCVFASKEGAEDDARDGARQIARRVRSGDVVVGVAASGITPFVHGALREARKYKASTILVTCNRLGVSRSAADVIIATVVGPEIITGSTRLKAGTATKLVLNRLTVATMVRLGKVYGNLMIDLQPKSEKLKDRAYRIIQQLTGVSRSEAARLLKQSRNSVKAVLFGKP